MGHETLPQHMLPAHILLAHTSPQLTSPQHTTRLKLKFHVPKLGKAVFGRTKDGVRPCSVGTGEE
jgi:hypothetical protein